MQIITKKGRVVIETSNGGYRNRVIIAETPEGLIIEQTGKNVIKSVAGFSLVKKRTGDKRKLVTETSKDLSCHYTAP